MTREIIYRDPGEAPDVDWIDKGRIDVDPAYQRPLDEARVSRIAEFFDWSSFGALVLAKKDDGRFNCTDGQHRLEAAKRHPDVSGKSQAVEDEARAFATTHRMPVIKAFASVWFKRCRKKRRAA